MTSPAWVLVVLAPILPILGILLGDGTMMQRTQMPTLLLVVGVLGMLAWWVSQQDFWLGLLAGWVTVSVIWTPTGLAYETAEAVTFGAVALTLMRSMTARMRQAAISAVIGGGVLQGMIGVYQKFWLDGTMNPNHEAIGMLGNPAYLGAYLAPLVPLASWWVMPVLLVGLIATGSVLAMMAAGVGLLVRYTEHPLRWSVCVAVAGLALLLLREHPFATSLNRVEVWLLALSTMTGWTALIGHGTGSWAVTVPDLQWTADVWRTQLFAWAHNDLLQLVYESGLIALGLLMAWVWTHRTAFQGKLGGAVVAMLLCSMGMFGLRLANLAVVMVVIVGVALSEHEERRAWAQLPA